MKIPRGVDVRPATDRLRQGVFSSLGECVVDSRFFDLFAGTGSYGLEAFSRGASGGVFVERDRQAISSINANIAAVCRSLGTGNEHLKTSLSDVLRWRPAESDRADLIFLDPPFADIPGLAPELFSRLREFINVESRGILVFQMPGEVELESPGWQFLRRIGKGRNQPTCCFYRAN